MVNSSRYIGSDQGYKMQSDALTNLTNATAQANQTVTQGFQNAIAGQVDYNKQMLSLIQARAQADIASASRPNGFSQLAEAGLKAYMSYEEAKQRKAIEAAKVQQDIVNDVEFAKTDEQLKQLVAKYEGSNWQAGREAFKAEASQLIANNYRPKNKEQAGYYVKLWDTVNSTYQKRAEYEGSRLQQELDKKRTEQKGIASNQLTFEIAPVLSQLPVATDPAKRNQLYNAAYDRLVSWQRQKLSEGVPESDVYAVMNEQLSLLTKQYQISSGNSAETSSKFENFRQGAADWQKYELQWRTGQMSYEDKIANQAALELLYPGFQSSRMAKLGDWEKEKTQLIELGQKMADLQQRAGNQALAREPLTDAAVNAISAKLYLQGEGAIKELENTPGLKDNPNIIRAITQARRLKEFQSAQFKVYQENQDLIIQVSQLELTNANNFANLTKSLYNKSADTLSPGQQLLFQAMQQVYGSQVDPAILQQAQQGTLSPENLQKLQEALNYQAGYIRQVQQNILEKAELNNKLIQRDFQDIFRAGLNRSIPELENLAKTSQDLITKELERIQQRSLEVQQDIKGQYGVQPNFSPSSQYAPVVDDSGKLALVPRTQAQRVKLADGSDIVTPVINDGARTSTTSPYGMRTHPVYGGQRFHAGADFHAPMGQRSVALVSGTVVYSGVQSGYGGMVDILGDNGKLYRYAHQRALVKPGQRVLPGQAVVVSNGSGVGTGAHLHFEVRTPRFGNNGQYDVSLNFGRQGTEDPLEHLKQLNSGASNVLAPRGNTTAFRQAPTLKAPGNSTLLANGGVIQANTYQRIGSNPAPVSNRFTPQRPASTGSVAGKVRLGQVDYDVNDDLGYSELRQNPRLMRAFHDTARRIGVPTAWIVDIVRQETGGINPYKDHSGKGNPNQNYGLFGFGSDSGFSREEFARLRAGQIDGEGQLKMYERYLKNSGWQDLVKKRNGNVTIADLWAASKMGWKMRHNYWSSGNLGVKSFPGTNLTYADEIALLGKWAGRRYDLGGSNSRRERNAAVGNSSMYPPHPLSNSLTSNGSSAPVRRPTALPPSTPTPIRGRNR